MNGRSDPRNANGEFTGDTLSLKAAFARSINTVAVQIAKEVGIHSVAEVAKAMGIKTPLEETPALSLGSIRRIIARTGQCVRHSY
ncbi:MAG: hypothetical protein R2738_06925 [Bacteroides graminisolvens]